MPPIAEPPAAGGDSSIRLRERDYSEPELEFMAAMQEYKQMSGRMFPTWSEILEVV